MNIKKLLEDSPLFKEVIKQWFLAKLLESVKTDENIPEEFKQDLINRGIIDEVLEKHIENNPHALFEIFDEHEIFIEIFRKKSQFTFDINSKQLENRYSMFRKDAEINAVTIAMLLLENKLNTQTTNGKS